MTTQGYTLTAAAAADLLGVIRYTRKQWGDALVRHYITKLEEGITRLAARQGIFTDMSALYPALRMAHCEHHYASAWGQVWQRSIRLLQFSPANNAADSGEMHSEMRGAFRIAVLACCPRRADAAS